MQQAQILSVGVAAPETSYTQAEVLEKLGIANRRIHQMFEGTRIKKRHLYLEEHTEHLDEPQPILLKRHEEGCLKIGEEAIYNALTKANINLDDLNYICVVTSTGFTLPAISARLIRKMNIKLSSRSKFAEKNPGNFKRTVHHPDSLSRFF